MVVQRHRHALPFHLFGKDIGGDAGGFVPHQLVARQHQLGGRGLVQAGNPLFQRSGLRDIGRKLAVVEGEDQLVVHQDVGAARLVFQLFDAGNQLAVVRHERQARVDLARHQRLTDEEFARLRRVDATVMDAPARVDGQPIQRGALVGHDLPGLLFPARVRPVFANQVRAHFFQPHGVDARHAAGIQARGVDQFSRHDPAARLLYQARARMDVETDFTRALVVAAFVAFETDIAQEARQQRQVQLLVGGFRLVDAPALLAHQGSQLRVHVVPFAQPDG
ncbi:hypothetical protein D3C86_1240670 [compost metagenome]